MSDEVIEAMDRVIEEDLTHPPHTVDARRVLRAALEEAEEFKGEDPDRVLWRLLQAAEPNDG